MSTIEKKRRTFLNKSVACIGAGYWGKNLIRNFYSLGALSTICETSEELRTVFEEKYPDVEVTGDLEGVFEDGDVDAVAIATPAETHGDLVRRALKAGKDVFVEKPLCLSVDEGEELVRLAEEEDRILMVGHLLWYHRAVLRLKEMVDSGELGRIQYIYSNRLNLGKIRREENILWSFAPHDISVILGLLEEMPQMVAAQGGNFVNEETADVTVSVLSFPSGAKAHVFVSWLHPVKEQRLVVVGEKKMAVFDDTAKENKLQLYPYTIDWQGTVPVAGKAEGEAVDIDMEEPLRAECQHFLDRVEDRETPRTDGEEALRVLKVLKASQDALERTRSSDPALTSVD